MAWIEMMSPRYIGCFLEIWGYKNVKNIKKHELKRSSSKEGTLFLRTPLVVFYHLFMVDCISKPHQNHTIHQNMKKLTFFPSCRGIFHHNTAWPVQFLICIWLTLTYVISDGKELIPSATEITHIYAIVPHPCYIIYWWYSFVTNFIAN